MKKAVSLFFGLIFVLLIFSPSANSQQYRTKEGIKQHADERRRQEAQRAEDRKTQVLDRSNVGVDRRRQTEELNRIDREKERKIKVVNDAEKEALKRSDERAKQAKETEKQTKERQPRKR